MVSANKAKLAQWRDKIQTGMGKFQRNKYVSAIAGGMMAILPVLDDGYLTCFDGRLIFVYLF